jgi:hypothetical protein
MRRLRATQNQVALSLFPFLAVLICTMGALIVLLVVVVRNAQVQAEEIATVVDSQQIEERQRRQAELAEQQRQREDSLWRLEVLAAQRKELAKQLDRSRLELSHFEEHHRRLAAQLEQKLRQAASFDQLDQNSQQDQQQMAADLASLRSAIAEAQRQLAEARQRVEATQRSFALLPYDGPQGTRRRPIYVECTQQAVILQPEGITFAPRDFSGPLGAGNPLDAALRAVREYMAASGLLAKGEEPYPLLVVRPGGSISYAAARAAMTSWDNEFGYELIDDEMKLAYGEPDAERARLIARAIDEARQRTEILRSAAPARFEGNEILSFAERPGRGTGDDELGLGTGGGGSYGPAMGAAAGGFSQGRSYPEGTGPQGHGSQGQGPASGDAGSANRSATDTGSRAGEDSSGGGGGAGTPGQQSMSRSPGAGGSETSSEAAQASDGQRQFPQQRMANTLGANWANKSASSGGTGYNRPISMTCYADRIEIPATAEQPMQTIAFLGSTGNGIRPLVEGVTRRVNSWGIAGQGAYWKPVLRIDVQPGAEQRFEDLQVLLDRSGLELERK